MRYIANALLIAVCVSGCSQGSEPVVEEPVALEEASPGLLARAAVTFEQARATALGRINGGTIEEAELEEEDDVLRYSFEVRGADGVLWDVEVDASSGDVLEAEMEEDDEDEDDDDHDGDDNHDDDDDDGGDANR